MDCACFWIRAAIAGRLQYSNRIGALLDETNAIEVLCAEVSSPGLDRKIKKERIYSFCRQSGESAPEVPDQGQRNFKAGFKASRTAKSSWNARSA